MSRPIRNIYGQPVPTTGGITSRELFKPLVDDRQAYLNRLQQQIPNTLWLITSIALIAVGVWAL